MPLEGLLDRNPDLMITNEVATYLRVSITTLYRLAREGQIPATKIGSRWRFKRASINKWLAEKEIYAGREKQRP